MHGTLVGAELEQQLATRQIEQLAGDLQLVADRQQTVMEATIDLDERQRQRGSWSRSLKRELRESTDEQSALAERLDELRSSLSEYPVIDMSLEQAASPMRAAAVRLDQTDVSEETVAEQRVAHEWLLAQA